MRLLHRFDDENAARTFRGALYAEGMESTANQARDGAYELWLHDEPRLDDARALLSKFLANPDDPRFAELARAAQAERRSRRKRDLELAKRNAKVQADLARRHRGGLGTVTIGLITISVGFYLLGLAGKADTVYRLFSFSTVLAPTGSTLVPYDPFAAMLYDIAHGQPWRGLTPIFLHGGFLHIFFNMWWLKDLGGAVENAYSSGYLLALVLVVGILSNAIGYAFTGPFFVGMSGVVYGLFAFIAVRERFDPNARLGMPPSLRTFMLAWLVFGFFAGRFGLHVANAVHMGGLLVGGTWGLLSSGILGRATRRR